MKLQPREKIMLIVLTVVAIISAIILYRVYNPSSEPTIPTGLSDSNAQDQQSSTQASSPTRNPTSSRTQQGSSTSTKQRISFQEFESHSTLKNCWILIEGEVYDISNFLSSYPVYIEKAESFCGTVGFEAGFIEGNQDLLSQLQQEALKIGTIS